MGSEQISEQARSHDSVKACLASGCRRVPSMSGDEADLQPVPWRYKSKGSFYCWHARPTYCGWRIDRFGEDAKTALGLSGFPDTAFSDEAHVQRTCRR